MADTVFRLALECIPRARSPSGEMLTKPFLDVCRLLLPVIDHFGTAMAMVKCDVGGNISRLDQRYDTDAAAYEKLYDVIKKEVAAGKAKESNSCSNALLWLTRAMDFLVELFHNLLSHSDWTMSQAANEAYVVTLKKWHGWIACAAFTMAMKFVPDREKFMELLGGGNLNADIESFVSSFAQVLQENHKFLRRIRAAYLSRSAAEMKCAVAGLYGFGSWTSDYNNQFGAKLSQPASSITTFMVLLDGGKETNTYEEVSKNRGYFDSGHGLVTIARCSDNDHTILQNHGTI